MADDRATARSLCVQAVGGGLSGLAAQFSEESALEVCIHVMRYINRRLYFLLYFRSGRQELVGKVCHGRADLQKTE